jgi:hypothetical protein
VLKKYKIQVSRKYSEEAFFMKMAVYRLMLAYPPLGIFSTPATSASFIPIIHTPLALSGA